MSFELFKQVHENDPPKEKLRLLIEQMDLAADDRLNARTADVWNNRSLQEYYLNEAVQMRLRVAWLTEELEKVLGDIENGSV